jgi:hypothetical protein
MGLKSGSRDAGLDDDEEASEGESTDPRPEDGATTDDSGSPRHDERAASPGDAAPATGEADDDRPSMDAIPYKLRRNKVNEGREQVPYFLREEVVAAEPALQDALEATLGEHVYKSDYREAAMVLAQRNPDLVAEVLREWGYDLDGS